MESLVSSWGWAAAFAGGARAGPRASRGDLASASELRAASWTRGGSCLQRETTAVTVTGRARSWPTLECFMCKNILGLGVVVTNIVLI